MHLTYRPNDVAPLLDSVRQTVLSGPVTISPCEDKDREKPIKPSPRQAMGLLHIHVMMLIRPSGKRCLGIGQDHHSLSMCYRAFRPKALGIGQAMTAARKIETASLSPLRGTTTRFPANFTQTKSRDTPIHGQDSRKLEGFRSTGALKHWTKVCRGEPLVGTPKFKPALLRGLRADATTAMMFDRSFRGR